MREPDEKTPRPGRPALDPRQRRWMLVGGLLGVWLGMALFASSANVTPTMKLNDISAAVKAGTIKSVVLEEDARTALVTFKNGDLKTFSYPYGYSAELTSKLVEAGVPVRVSPPPRPNPFFALIGSLLPLGLLILFLLWLMRKGSGGGLLGVGRLGSKKEAPVDVPQTRFSDVGGVDEAVTDLREVVEYLAKPEKFARAGASVPRGVLLVGPPGTGKTLLARAVAGEAGVPFFALSGSDFVEMFVGVGAARVRSLFEKARGAGKAIVFIDEIDAVGKARTNINTNGASEERESTLNALLVEMDGFAETQVIVLAATNRPDTLDAALTRPGRFDRKIAIPAPDRKGREQILELYAAKRNVDADVDFAALARRIPGLTGADIAALFNEAALNVARRGEEVIQRADLEEAIAVVTLGRERRTAAVTDRDREITAWHEAGHAVAALMNPEADDPVSVSIIPRGQAGGVTWLGGNDNAFTTKTQALAQLTTAMAGRAAEETLLHGDFTQGAQGDLAGATGLAMQMVSHWGMGTRMMRVDENQLIMGADTARVNDEVAALIEDGLLRARTLLSENADLLERVAVTLLEEESLTLEQLKALRDSGASTSAPTSEA